MKELLHSKFFAVSGKDGPSITIRQRNLKQLFKITKLTTTILVIAITHLSATTLAQKVTISEEKGNLKSVLKVLAKKTNYLVVYSNYVIQKSKPVSIHAKNQELKEVLQEIFQAQPLTFEIQDKTILVKEKIVESKEAEYPKPVSTAQDRLVIGIVFDENGQPLPGVSVLSKLDMKAATATDANGHFQIRLLNDNDLIIFRMIGYLSQEVTVPRDQNIGLKITLVPAVAGLNEVQVIGYGTTTKRLNTGSVSSVSSAVIAQQPISNPLATLQGRMPGVVVTQSNGLPGSGYDVQIRGRQSLGAGLLPLYVIDGVPFTLLNRTFGTSSTDALNASGSTGANGSVSPFALIAPDDIERIDVLKDADATAIYGSKGANGVILITTKKGKSGKTQLNVNLYSGIGEVNRSVPMLNTSDYLALRRQAYAKSGTVITATNAPDLTLWDQNAYTDWQKMFIGGTAHTTNADVAISGGAAKNTFLFSSNYRKEGTVYPGDFGANTFSNRLNAGHKSEDNKFSVNGSVNYTYMNNNLIGTDLTTLYNLPPNLPLNNPDGSLYWFGSITNPLSNFLKTYKTTTTNFISNVNLQYSPVTGLYMRLNGGYTLTGLTQNLTNPVSSQNPATAIPGSTNTLRYNTISNSNYIVEPQAQYTRQIGLGKLDALIGTTFQRTLSSGVSATATGFSSDLLINSLSNATTVSSLSAPYTDYRYNSLFARVNYNIKDKYLLNGTFRRDGSSRFGPDHKFGNFGAIGVSWIFTEEESLKKYGFLSFGKLRASYGVTGNDQIGNYMYDAYYAAAAGTANAYQGTSILYPATAPNPNLVWETNKKLDVGLEIGIFKNRIFIHADYYQNRSSNSLVDIAVPLQSGFTVYTGNLPALVINKGFEFDINTENIQNKQFSWTSQFNLTIARNELAKVDNVSSFFNASNFVIGQPVNLQFLYQYIGLDPVTGVPAYQDVNNDGVINFSGDRKPAPLGFPFYGGFGNTFKYQNFELSIFLQYNHRNGFINNATNPLGLGLANQNTSALNRWMNPGDQNLLPAATAVTNNNYAFYGSSTAVWGDASFIKLKTANLSYSFPSPWIRKIGLSVLNIYARGENLATWSKQKYVLDPETTSPGGGGAGSIVMPPLRTIVLGLNCTF